MVPFFHGFLQVEGFFWCDARTGDETLVHAVGEEVETGLCDQA